MICPICRNNALQQTKLELDLPAYTCDRCEGVWIDYKEYLAWLETHRSIAVHHEDAANPISAQDVPTPKICPACNRIMGHYKILPNTDFHLDRCAQCGGVWCDKLEWQVLVAHDIQDKIHLFHTQSWQSQLRQEETREMLERLYKEKIGAADLEKIKEIRNWLTAHPQRGMLMAFLQSKDPYKM